MARIKIQLPEHLIFSTTLKIRITDINYGKHLGNEVVLGYMQETRYRFYNSLGYKDELSIDGTSTIQADTAIQYKGEGFHGDEILVELYATDLTPKSIDFYYRLSAGERVIALGKTGIAFYNYETGKIAPMPKSFKSKVEALLK